MGNTKGKIDFAVGGQALLEGILMRSPNHNVIVVRTPAGEINDKQEFYQTVISRHKLLNIPFVRGIINMLEMMVIGTKALNYSSLKALEEEEKPEPEEGSSFNKISIILSMVFGLGIAILLFKFIPLWITDFLSNYLVLLKENYLLYNLMDAGLKTSIFVGYIALMTLIPDIKRVFMYHGAEHKSIMTYENGLDLTVENARKQSRFHPRCGTSFILLVFLISIVIFTLLPKNPDFITNFSIRLLALPLVAGVSYEILKLSAKKSKNWFFRAIASPGLLMQRLTTKEPDDKILEVGLHSLKLALAAEEEYLKNKNVP
jgi:uncharacterized protein YqhQ